MASLKKECQLFAKSVNYFLLFGIFSVCFCCGQAASGAEVHTSLGEFFLGQLLYTSKWN